MTVFPLLLLLGADRVVSVDKREQADGFHEIKVQVQTDVDGARVADVYWNEKKKQLSTLKKYEVLKKTPDEKVSYLQIKIPIIKDRDYTVRILRYADEANGLYQFTGKCITDMGPPPNDDHVRVTRCAAQLTIERHEGGTLITYVAHANPEGSVPKWLANVVAPRATVEIVEKLIASARERSSNE